MEDFMKTPTALNFYAVLLTIFLTVSVALADQSKESAAISSAEIFLQLVDSGHFAESWNATSSFFKQQVTKQQWIKQLKSFRPTFGNLTVREITNKNFTQSMPGAPDGEYVVIQFSTSFTNKENATETVTLTFDSDGSWRVLGYYIR